ncbi:MAG TPA: PaaI family thioesterase [Solirubrobacteraceae bacterium]|nr:PaaI family thioesterase [Solirubrobacteraceae bacterium]
MAEAPVWEPVVAYDRSFDARYGLEIAGHDAEAGELRGRIAVRDELLTGHGLVHGGVFAAAAEAIASTGTALVVTGDGGAAMGLSNDTTVLADVREGTIQLHARAVHRGEREWVWAVDATGDDERPVAHSRVTVAVRQLRRTS